MIRKWRFESSLRYDKVYKKIKMVPTSFTIIIKRDLNLPQEFPSYTYEAIAKNGNNVKKATILMIPDDWYAQLSGDRHPVPKTSFKRVVFSSLIFSVSAVAQFSCDIFIDCKDNRAELLQYLEFFAKTYNMILKLKPGSVDSYAMFGSAAKKAIYIN